MAAADIPDHLRDGDYFHHIDMGFLNRRLCMSALMADGRELYSQQAMQGNDHGTLLSNDHLLVTMLIDRCAMAKTPSLVEALTLAHQKHLFMSTERLVPCPEVYSAARVEQEVLLDIDFGKPVRVAYHTEHIVSSTGRMTLAEGVKGGYVESIIGLLHDRGDHWEIEALVMGAPWLDHPRNGKASSTLMWMAREFGELLAEDIDQFAKLTDVNVASADEWTTVMRAMPEAEVKAKIASLLAEPIKKDWGGERNDLFAGNVSVHGRRRNAAFLLKGRTNFREMTLDICGKRADQILRLVQSEADISVVQHSHQIGEAVRETLRALVVRPGRPPKFCVMDGQTTYRLIKAYDLL